MYNSFPTIENTCVIILTYLEPQLTPIFEGQPPKTRPNFQSKQGAPFGFQDGSGIYKASPPLELPAIHEKLRLSKTSKRLDQVFHPKFPIEEAFHNRTSRICWFPHWNFHLRGDSSIRDLFWDGEIVSLSKVVGDLQRWGNQARSRLESPISRAFLLLVRFFAGKVAWIF